jgi:hypothetical protein
MIVHKHLLCVGLVLGMLGRAGADNAALTTGGRPTVMDSHPSVSMQSEIVKLVVHWNRVETDALFVFANSGAACRVRMGFPDFGLWAYDYKKSRPTTTFRSYHSYVDGKLVKTKLVLGMNRRDQWQTKTVSFPTNGKRTVREVYTTDLGGIGARKPIALASYLLHTGASWKGSIGTASILVTFAPDSEVGTPIDVLFGDQALLEGDSIITQIAKSGGVFAIGPSKPILRGRTLDFEVQGLRPAAKDDILVGFAYPKRMIKWEEQRLKNIGKK